MTSSLPPDYYEILGCQATDSIDVIKKSYQLLILKHHPDKNTSQTNANGDRDIERFHEIDEAWKVLRDAEQRKQYDAERQQHKFNETPIVHAIVRRAEFDWNAELEHFVYPCRCGGLFVLPEDCVSEIPTPDQMDELFIECDECSFVIQLLGNAV